MRSIRAITLSPTMTQISSAMPKNITPPNYKTCFSFKTLSMRRLPDRVQIMNNAFWIVVAEENFAVGHLDANSLIAPHVGATIADATDAVAAGDAPTVGRVFLDVADRDSAQVKTQRANLDP